jgi:hypothetical protein
MQPVLQLDVKLCPEIFQLPLIPSLFLYKFALSYWEEDMEEAQRAGFQMSPVSAGLMTDKQGKVCLPEKVAYAIIKLVHSSTHYRKETVQLA